MPSFRSLHFNAQSETGASMISGHLKKPASLDGLLNVPDRMRAVAPTEEEVTRMNTASAWNLETASRYHLQTLLEEQDSVLLAEITSPQSPQLVPDMKIESVRDMALTATQTVVFQQTAKTVPIFGTRAVVEVDGASRQLVAVDGVITDVPNISSVPKLGLAQVIEKLAAYGSVSAEDISSVGVPALNFYPSPPDHDGRVAEWLLVYYFHNVPLNLSDTTLGKDAPAIPPPSCCGWTQSNGSRQYECLVDANTGEIVSVFPSSPHAALDVPVPLLGNDVFGVSRNFDGLAIYGPGNPAPSFQLTDPLRSLETFDAAFADIATNHGLPANPVREPQANFGNAAPEAVMAHYHATVVFDFFNNVLKRNSVDDKGMKLMSYVNCYNSDGNGDASPIWRNAMWSQQKMWYGQLPDGHGGYTSTARFLDIIAHELTHGVTQTSAGLIYQTESGALNESFSDIFGVIVNNWYPGQPNPLAGWVWSLGDGWGGLGHALRNVADPTLGGQMKWPNGPAQPDHMKDFVKFPGQQPSRYNDWLGVHINSGIHNKAFYKVITAADSGGNLVFDPLEGNRSVTP